MTMVAQLKESHHLAVASLEQHATSEQQAANDRATIVLNGLSLVYVSLHWKYAA